MSRALKQYQSSEIAPSSSAPVPSQIRCEWIRFSSSSSVRIHDALGGTSISSSFSIAGDERVLVRLEREVVDPRRVRDRLPPLFCSMFFSKPVCR